MERISTELIDCPECLTNAAISNSSSRGNLRGYLYALAVRLISKQYHCGIRVSSLEVGLPIGGIFSRERTQRSQRGVTTKYTKDTKGDANRTERRRKVRLGSAAALAASSGDAPPRGRNTG